ncbi:hypothetical protein [Pseudoduganella sp. HUAS MS19]
MFLTSDESNKETSNEISDLDACEQERVAGGPEVENDPGQP